MGNGAFQRVRGWLRHGAEAVGAGLLGVTFLAFVVQVGFRYVLDDPLSWTLEACLTLWLWLVFWGGAFLLAPRDHVSFDMLYEACNTRVRRVFALISSLSIVVAFAVSLPATWSFISFYSIQDSATLGIRMDYVFSVYALFAVGTIIRYGWRVVCLLRGDPPDPVVTTP